jgi:hypothetical protein
MIHFFGNFFVGFTNVLHIVLNFLPLKVSRIADARYIYFIVSYLMFRNINFSYENL